MLLEKILEEKKREVEERKIRFPLSATAPHAGGQPGRFMEALKKPGLSVIAEFKRKSPSAGPIAAKADPADRALLYEKNGADAVSVLTDMRFFGGSIDDLRAVKQAVRLPVLRKEFIIDPYQVHESALSGADAVLLIVRLLDDSALRRLLDLSHRLGMDALVEVHGALELVRALEAGASVIGVNNRDLDTLQVDLRTSLRLAAGIPPGKIKVSESGIRSGEDAVLLRRAGFDAILAGEILMRSGGSKVMPRDLKGGTT